ncbi:hypothetical protein CORC01_12471 [Colletotrichum orchidophilum]|uniref:Uncharacterized protein n=1 Tax=Colletotrichum orchidophilum TaxID=1209926 RepID=A0A1G4ASZ3_9PEZI|nr:uncharacterized protein CORC01_12471 [Colletotrichum orchidophilum]OHE92235.1 hypothetical protein CORC01_12471 [Colletotrichum orchidophilum]
MHSRNGRPQLHPVPAMLSTTTTMDNADPEGHILGIIGAPAACRRKPPSNLQGQTSYEPAKAYIKRHERCNSWTDEAVFFATPRRLLPCHQSELKMHRTISITPRRTA